MANLSIRKLDEDTAKRLRIRAAQNGVSMEEEVRRILQRAVASPSRLGDLALQIFSPAYSDEAFRLPDRTVAEPISFE